MLAPLPRRVLAAGLLVLSVALLAGCGSGSTRPKGISADFQRRASDACSRAVGAIGIVNFTDLPGVPAFTRISRSLVAASGRIRAATVSGQDDRKAQARLADGFDKAASAVDDYVTGVRNSAPDDQRYSRMIAALGDMGSEGQRAGTNACVVPTEA
jgi:hypothetical protein